MASAAPRGITRPHRDNALPTPPNSDPPEGPVVDEPETDPEETAAQTNTTASLMAALDRAHLVKT